MRLKYTSTNRFYNRFTSRLSLFETEAEISVACILFAEMIAMSEIRGMENKNLEIAFAMRFFVLHCNNIVIKRNENYKLQTKNRSQLVAYEWQFDYLKGRSK